MIGAGKRNPHAGCLLLQSCRFGLHPPFELVAILIKTLKPKPSLNHYVQMKSLIVRWRGRHISDGGYNTREGVEGEPGV